MQTKMSQLFYCFEADNYGLQNGENSQICPQRSHGATKKTKCSVESEVVTRLYGDLDNDDVGQVRQERGRERERER